MKVFLDTSVLLDILARHEPFYAASAEVWSLAESGTVQGFISAISFNNIYYVIRKTAGKRNADKALRILRDIFAPVAPDTLILNQAIDSTMNDFEDAIQFHSAIRAGADCLITRDPGHFRKVETNMAISTPDEFLAVWRQRRVR
ncbi:MAG: PIN domain-containing protein [Lentisphaerae bacterium]|nr:PIN domain-containing protein [Lentisphaerota bacterium]